MKFFKISKETGEKKEVAYEEAHRMLSANYTEKVCTYDEMLSEEGRIPLMFSILEVKAD